MLGQPLFPSSLGSFGLSETGGGSPLGWRTHTPELARQPCGVGGRPGEILLGLRQQVGRLAKAIAGAPEQSSWPSQCLHLLPERFTSLTGRCDSGTCLVEAPGEGPREAVVVGLFGRCHPESRQNASAVGAGPRHRYRHEPGTGPA